MDYDRFRKFAIEYYNKNKRTIKETIATLNRISSSFPPEMLERNYGIRISEDALLLGFGYARKKEDSLEGPKAIPAPILVDEESRKRNLYAFGTIGSGKTYFLLHVIRNDILAGKSVVAIDPKPSSEFLDVVVWSLLEADRLSDFRYMTYNFPSISYTINPLSRYFLPDEVFSILTSGIFVKDPFFMEVAKELTTVIVLVLHLKELLEGRESSFTIKDVLTYMVRTNFEALYREFQDLSERIRSNYPHLTEYISALGNLMTLIKNSPPDYFSKVTTTLRVHLAQLSVGIPGKLVSDPSGGNFCEEIERGETPVVFVQLSSLQNPEVTRKISRLISSMVRTLAGRYSSVKKTINPPLSFIVDEFFNVVHVGFEELLSKCREAGVQFTAVSQTISQLSEAVGENLAYDILGYFSTLLSFSVPDKLTPEFVAERLGKVKGFRTGIRYQDGGEYFVSENEDYVVSPSDLRNLKPRHFYFKNYDVLAYGKTIDFHKPDFEVEVDVSPGIV